jgi:pyruvate-ferredoxin/flavodoxin oxidoreductase
MVYPYAVIRPVVIDEKQLNSAPKGMVTKALNGMDNYKFAIIVSTYDCTGCGV